MKKYVKKTPKRVLLISSLCFLGLLCFIVFYYLNKPVDAQDDLKVQTVKPEMPIFDNAPEVIETQENPSILDADTLGSNLVKEQFTLLADIYAEQAKYPTSSLPIKDLDLAKTPAPFEQANVSMKVFDDNAELTTISIDASVDKFQYFEGDDIQIRVVINGAEAHTFFSAEANIQNENSDPLLTTNKQLVSDSNHSNVLLAMVDTNNFKADGKSNELLLRVQVQIDGKQHITTVPFYYSYASARLQAVAGSQPKDEYLEIPVQYEVFESGYYYVTGYLDDAQTNQPLIRLQAEGQMSEGRDELLLKAHQLALKDAGSPGPYKLRIASSYRGANPGEGNDVPTAIDASFFDIPAFAFDRYADTAYSNQEVSDRLEALRELAE